MIQLLKKLFVSKPKKKDFSSFFRNASQEEQKRMLEDVARKANQDQRDLVKQYEQANQKAA
jgi:hypothetical protein